MNSLLTKFWEQHRVNRRIRLKRRRARHHIPRPKLNAKELIEFLQSRFIKTTGELSKVRSATDPTVGDVIRCFGSWNECIKQAYGELPKQVTIPVSPQHIVDAVMLLKIGTREKYIKQRREQPSILPSLHQVRKYYPTFTELMTEVEKRSADLALTKYLELHRKLGRTPLVDDCRRWQVSLSPLTKSFRGKKQLDSALGALA